MDNPSTTTTIVIFGASGDLARTKLVPALFSLRKKGRLGEHVRVVGSARRPYSEDAFRELMKEEKPSSAWDDFAERLHYVPADVTKLEDVTRLDERLRALEGGRANRIYYFAIAPSLYERAIATLGEARLNDESEGYRRVIIEKPFGHDRASAEALNRRVHEVFEERQVYRIDHFLGKETAQNILFLRFANTVFEPLWNRNYVDHVQISVAETVDASGRGAFYDDNGVLRDMFQNHLLQLMSLVAMEPPASFDSEAVRNEKTKLLSSVRPVGSGESIADATARGQYEGYRDSEGVAHDSSTATYGALKLYVDNWRWRGVPFYLRSGKALREKFSEIIIQFRSPPHMMFPLPPDTRIRSNYLAICVQPDEGTHLRFEAKVPDTRAELRSVDMEFHYAEDFDGIDIPDAYERLLLDALEGDPSLFARTDGIETAWSIVDPVIEAWREGTPTLELYERGASGPRSAAELLSRDGRAWLRGCGTH